MQIQLNGATQEVADDLTLAALVETLELGAKRIAVEVNQELVPRTQHGTHRLQPGDRVEIVQAIGGG
jgi:sulfur carrier protein